MAFKVGDKVKYDSGDWLFYGTVTAVFENSINPCYRVTVDRMVKMNCKFSITQFEFELALDQDVALPDNLSKVIEPVTEVPAKKTRAGAWERNFALFQQGERSNPIYTWMNRNRRLFKTDKLPKDKLEMLTSIQFPFEPSKRRGRIAKREKAAQLPADKPKRTKASAWERNLELYRKGEKGNTVYAWISRNRKLYNANKLSEEQVSKLTEANFHFKVPPREKLLDNWDKQYRLWQNGNRNRSLQIWRETSVKRYTNGKLSQDRIDKLKEVGILK